MAVAPKLRPRVRIRHTRWVFACFVLFVPTQAAVVLSGPLMIHVGAFFVVTLYALQRVPARTLFRLTLPVLLPAVLTGIARSGVTAFQWDISPAFAVWLTTLRFMILVWSAYLLTVTCAIRQALLQTLPRNRSVRSWAAMSAWFVLVLLPETAQILREAHTAAMFREGIPLGRRLRAISLSALPRILSAANNRADALALRLAPLLTQETVHHTEEQGIPPSV